MLHPELLHSLQAHRVSQRFGNRGVPAKLPGVGKDGVGAVQEPQFAVFVRLNVVHETAPASSQRGRGREVTAEHPVAEWLGDDGCFIL